MTTLQIVSFAKGEIGPELAGRVDTSAYQIGLATAQNTIVHVYGGISNRPGTEFVGEVQNFSVASRLVEFQFKTTDRYLLEFSDFTMRVIRDGGHVLEAAFGVTDITSYNPLVLSVPGNDFAQGDHIVINGLGGATRLNGRRFGVGIVSGSSVPLIDLPTGSPVNGSSFDHFTSNGTAARVYTVGTQYAAADLMELKFVQSADVLTITHASYPPADLSRTGHTAWFFTAPSFAPATPRPINLTVTQQGTAGTITARYRVTATDATTGEESLSATSVNTFSITNITTANPAKVTAAGHGFVEGDPIGIWGVVGMVELNDREFTATNVTTNTFDLLGENTLAYHAWVSGGTCARTFFEITNGANPSDNEVSWDLTPNTSQYTIYKAKDGVYGICGVSSSAHYRESNVDPDTSTSPPSSRNPFIGAGNYPGVSTYYEQRQVYGGSFSAPDTSFYSQPGNRSNFSVSTPVQASDAITATLTSRQVNEIRHFIPANDLIVFTSGSEWRVNAGGASSFAADTISQKPQSTWGCSHMRPFVIGITALFVPETQNSIRTLSYSFQYDSYVGTDLTKWAAHLFRQYQMVDWAYAQRPDPIVHVVRSDGTLCALTFDEEQQVVAWTRWVTAGTYERVAVTRLDAGAIEDTAYFVVRRIINGATVRYIERTHTRLFNDVRDCFFVDAGLSLDIPIPITSVVLGDGAVAIGAANHGRTTGDTIDISDIQWTPVYDDVDTASQPDQLNGGRFTVTDVSDVNNFTIAADTTGWSAYLSGGNLRVPVTHVAGLDHLEGQPVAVLADGNVVSGLTVKDGAITLPRAASRVHAGLKYIADIQTLDMEPSQGTIQNRIRKFSKVTVRFKDSRGLFIGTDLADLYEMKQREFEDMSDPTLLLTGTREITLSSDWENSSKLFLRQRYPLPMTILSVMPEVDVSD